MGVLDGVADVDEQLEPLRGGQVVLVAELGDGNTLDQLHHEIGASRIGGPRIQHPGDVRMVHEGQRLSFRLEAGDHLGRIHPRLDDLEGDLAPHRPFLLGHVDDAEAPFADPLQQLVRTDLGPQAFGDGDVGAGEFAGRSLQKTLRFVMAGQERLDLAAETGIAGARLLEKPRTFRDGSLQGGFEQLAFAQGMFAHGMDPPLPYAQSASPACREYP